MIVVDTKVSEAKSLGAVTVVGAMKGAGASKRKNTEKKGGPVSKIAATKPTKTNKKKV
jgi:hypothetical protein